MTKHEITFAVALIGIILPLSAHGQDNQCVSCHLDRVETSSSQSLSLARDHLDDWDRSVHAASDVGCDACHGGNPRAQSEVEAHERILSSTNPAGPVYFRNLPDTCGGCHAPQLEAFETSRHYGLLQAGVRRAPTCGTCHGAVAARFPATRGIESVCASCHGQDGSAPMSEYQAQVGLMRALIQDNRYQLALARTVIGHIRDPERREALDAAYRDAAAPLDDATAAWHSFTFDTAVDPLELAGRRISALIEQLQSSEEPAGR